MCTSERKIYWRYRIYARIIYVKHFPCMIFPSKLFVSSFFNLQRSIAWRQSGLENISRDIERKHTNVMVPWAAGREYRHLISIRIFLECRHESYIAALWVNIEDSADGIRRYRKQRCFEALRYIDVKAWQRSIDIYVIPSKCFYVVSSIRTSWAKTFEIK